ncbi:MAG: hypothetical protein WCH01_04520 [Methylococcaceae bacterium]
MSVIQNDVVQAPVEMPCSTTMPPVWYLNHYRCPTCQLAWQDEWDCTCNDRCPSCHQEIVAFKSDLIDY